MATKTLIPRKIPLTRPAIMPKIGDEFEIRTSDLYVYRKVTAVNRINFKYSCQYFNIIMENLSLPIWRYKDAKVNRI